MSKQYQNIAFTKGDSKFVHVNADKSVDELIFRAKSARVPVLGGSVDMASGHVTYNRPMQVTTVEGMPPAYINEGVKISFNVISGEDAHIQVLLDEAIRCMTVARQQYNLASGLVPTGLASFELAAPGVQE